MFFEFKVYKADHPWTQTKPRICSSHDNDDIINIVHVFNFLLWNHNTRTILRTIHRAIKLNHWSWESQRRIQHFTIYEIQYLSIQFLEYVIWKIQKVWKYCNHRPHEIYTNVQGVSTPSHFQPVAGISQYRTTVKISLTAQCDVGQDVVCYLWTSGSFVDMCEVNFSVASFGFISEIIFFFSFHFKHITIRNLIHKIFNINSDDITSVRTRRKLIKWDPFPFPGDELYNLIKIRF